MSMRTNDSSPYSLGSLEYVSEMTDKIESMRETLLSNLILLSEIPAETFKEQDRNQALINRFSEVGMLNTGLDEKSNGVGILQGTEEDSYILIVAHSDTVYSENKDHALTITPNDITGAGVADNSLGLAALATLPDVLKGLDISLKSSLILMGSTMSMGRGNIQGIRFFLENNDLPIKAAICVEGVELGRVSHMAMGMLRGEIICRTSAEKEWSGFSSENAIITLNEVINKINSIPVPRRPRSSINLGRIEGGTEYNKKAVEARLRFEVRSESAETVDEIGFLLKEAVAEVKSKTGDSITMDFLAKRSPGGINFSHPMVRAARSILEELKITPRYESSTSELAGLVANQIDAITIGLTNSTEIGTETEKIKIKPVYKGLAQLVALIQAIDGGTHVGN